MKKIFLIIVLILLPFSMFSQSDSLGDYTPSIFSKYKIPFIKYEILDFTGGIDFTINNSYQVWGFDNSNGETKNTYRSLNFRPTYSYYLEDDNSRYTSNIFFDINQGKNHSKYRKYDGTKINNESLDNHILFKGKFSGIQYSKLVNYKFESEFEFDFKERESDNVYNTDNKYHNYLRDKRQVYRGGVGVGLGKVCDVTPLIQAIRFQERSKKINLIDENFNDETVVELAKKFSRENIYSDYFDRGNKYLWKDIDEVLQKEDIKIEDLNFYSSNYLLESLSEIRFRRYTGYEIFLNIGIEYFKITTNRNYSLYPYENYTIYLYDDEFRELAVSYLSLDFQWFYQFGINSQLEVKVNFRGGPQLIKHNQTKQYYQGEFTSDYYYEISDKLLMNLGIRFNHIIENTNYHKYHYSYDAHINMDYFIEDNVAVNAKLLWQLLEINDSYFNQVNYTSKQNYYFNFAVGFKYFINTSIFTN